MVSNKTAKYEAMTSEAVQKIVTFVEKMVNFHVFSTIFK